MCKFYKIQDEVFNAIDNRVTSREAIFRIARLIGLIEETETENIEADTERDIVKICGVEFRVERKCLFCDYPENCEDCPVEDGAEPTRYICPCGQYEFDPLNRTDVEIDDDAVVYGECPECGAYQILRIVPYDALRRDNL